MTPLEETTRPQWKLRQVLTALRSHRAGDFGLSAQLFDTMLTDDELPGCLQSRGDATLRSEFSLKVPEREKLKPRERTFQQKFPCYFPDGELFDFIIEHLMHGTAIGVLDWDTSGEIWTYKFRALPIEHLHWREDEKRFYYTALEGDLPVTPGDGKWVLMTQGQRGWRWGLVRSLAQTWITKWLSIGDWQRYSQKHGLPIFKADVPIWRDAEEKDQFIEDLADIESEGIVGLPKDEQGEGYDLTLLEATTLSWQGFEAAIARCDRKFQITTLGGNLGVEVTGSGGNRAAADTHGAKLDAHKAKRDAKRLGECLQEQAVAAFFMLNYGPSAEVPYPYWDVCPEDTVRVWENSRLQFSNTIKTLGDAGYSVKNIEQVAGELGLELEAGPPKGSAADTAKTVAEKPPPKPAGAPAAKKKKAAK